MTTTLDEAFAAAIDAAEELQRGNYKIRDVREALDDLQDAAIAAGRADARHREAAEGDSPVPPGDLELTGIHINAVMAARRDAARPGATDRNPEAAGYRALWLAGSNAARNDTVPRDPAIKGAKP